MKENKSKFKYTTSLWILLLPTLVSANIFDNYEKAWTAYFSIHYNRKQIVEIGFSITPGLVKKRGK